MKTTTCLWIGALLGALTLTGCKTASPEPSSPVAPPATITSTSSYLVTLAKSAPRIVSVGDEFEYELSVAAQADLTEATVVDTLPAGVSFISADPVGTRDGNKLTWRLGNLSRGRKN